VYTSGHQDSQLELDPFGRLQCEEQRDAVVPRRGIPQPSGRVDCRLHLLDPVRDNYNVKSPKYVCITTYQSGAKSNPNPNRIPNPTTKQHAMANIQLNIVTCPLRFQINSYDTGCCTVRTTIGCNCHTAHLIRRQGIPAGVSFPSCPAMCGCSS